MDFELLFTIALGSFIGGCLPLALMYLYRRRIMRATLKLAIGSAPEEVRQAVIGVFCEWEDKKDKDGNTVRMYKPSPFLLGFFESVLPVVVEIAWKSLGGKLGNLPVGPDGKMNMLAPVMKRMMDGKKIGFNDFLPFLMEKIAPVIQNFIGGIGKPAEGTVLEAAKAPAQAGLTKLG